MIYPKVFGIGFHKTGTSSLAWALGQMGYRVAGPNGVDDPFIEKNVYRMARRLVPRYDAFQDNPWPLLYRFADEQCPGSKFVLTIRPADAWLQSAIRHFADYPTPMRQWIYGAAAPQDHEQRYLERYNTHNDEVQNYFRFRSSDLLLLDVAEPDAWTRLGIFLGQPAPAAALPHLNTASETHAGYTPLAKTARRWLRTARQFTGYGL